LAPKYGGSAQYPPFQVYEVPRGAHSSAIQTWRADGLAGRGLRDSVGGRILALTAISWALAPDRADNKIAPDKNKIFVIFLIVNKIWFYMTKIH